MLGSPTQAGAALARLRGRAQRVGLGDRARAARTWMWAETFSTIFSMNPEDWISSNLETGQRTRQCPSSPS